jgi:hypothetical protein
VVVAVVVGAAPASATHPHRLHPQRWEAVAGAAVSIQGVADITKRLATDGFSGFRAERAEYGFEVERELPNRSLARVLQARLAAAGFSGDLERS